MWKRWSLIMLWLSTDSATYRVLILYNFLLQNEWQLLHFEQAFAIKIVFSMALMAHMYWQADLCTRARTSANIPVNGRLCVCSIGHTQAWEWGRIRVQVYMDTHTCMHTWICICAYTHTLDIIHTHTHTIIHTHANINSKMHTHE